MKIKNAKLPNIEAIIAETKKSRERIKHEHEESLKSEVESAYSTILDNMNKASTLGLDQCSVNISNKEVANIIMKDCAEGKYTVKIKGESLIIGWNV